MRLATKELLEILRDRRTIITLVMMPLLVYPLMGIVVQKLMLQTVSQNTEVVYRLGFEDEPEAERFGKIFRQGQATALQSLGGLEPPKLGTAQNPRFESFFPEMLTLEQLVRLGQVDLGITRGKGENVGGRYRLLHNPKSDFSYNAMQFIGKRLRLANDQFMWQITGGPNRKFELPATYQEVAVEVEAGQPTLLTFVPLMLVLMTITGAVYPAIDVTAG